jgi:phage-related minor tail protein
MKNISIGLSLLILALLSSCGRDLEQAKRYSDIKSETDSLITQANLIINVQKAMTDSLVKIRDNIYKDKTQKFKLPELDKKVTKVVEFKTNLENVRKHLEAIKKFAEKGEKATKSLIFYKRKYITYATEIQVHDENIMIQEITNGLSARKYIKMYLPKEKK